MLLGNSQELLFSYEEEQHPSEKSLKSDCYLPTTPGHPQPVVTGTPKLHEKLRKPKVADEDAEAALEVTPNICLINCLG